MTTAKSPWVIQGNNTDATPPPTGAPGPAGPRRIEKGTDQQEDFWADLTDCQANILVEARAGSGKSSSCREGMFRMLDARRQGLRYTVFNKQNADEFRGHCPPGVEVGTCHALGMRALRRSHPGSEVDRNRSYVLMDSLHGAQKFPRWLRKAIAGVVSLAKNMALRPDSPGLDGQMLELIDNYDVRCYRREREVIEYASRVLDLSSKRTSSIDFDDMIWLPGLLGVDPLEPAVSFLDEVQDFNPAQHDLIPIITGGGRVIAVGDSHQAIYAFRGADPQSMRRLGSTLEADPTGLIRQPLTVTFRCPKSHVELAQQFVPDLSAYEGNAEGAVERGLSLDAALPRLAGGDMVLCPHNAPLVGVALGLIRERRRCVVRGRAIGDSLLAIFRSLEGGSIAQRAKSLDEWQSREVNRLADRDGTEEAVEGVRDRAAGLHAVLAACTGPEQVEDCVNTLFSDDLPGAGLGVVIFSTVHRAKGLEADRVWLLETPARKPATDWQARQDCNLRYVALTRSKNFLGFVDLK